MDRFPVDPLILDFSHRNKLLQNRFAKFGAEF